MNVIKNKYFFLFLEYLRISLTNQWQISDDLHSAQLGEYYFAFPEKTMENQKGGQRSIIFDKNGIPHESDLYRCAR